MSGGVCVVGSCGTVRRASGVCVHESPCMWTDVCGVGDNVDRIVVLGVFAHCNQEVPCYCGGPILVRIGQSEEGEETRGWWEAVGGQSLSFLPGVPLLGPQIWRSATLPTVCRDG